MRRLIFRDKPEQDPALASSSEPASLSDFPRHVFEGAALAIHAADTGRGYRGEPVAELPENVAAAVRSVHVWRASRERLDSERLESSLQANLRLMEALGKGR